MHFKIIISVLIIFSGFSCVQENIIPPQPVLKTFQELYPDAKDVEWEKEGKNFEAEFLVDGDEISVEFSSDGQVLETEKEDDDESDSEADLEENDIKDNDDDN